MDLFDLFGPLMSPELPSGGPGKRSGLLDFVAFLILPVLLALVVFALGIEALGPASLLLLAGGGSAFVYWLSRRAGHDLGPALMRSIGCVVVSLGVLLAVAVIKALGAFLTWS